MWEWLESWLAREVLSLKMIKMKMKRRGLSNVHDIMNRIKKNIYSNKIIGKILRRATRISYLYTESPPKRFYWFLSYTYSAMSIYVQEGEFQPSSFEVRTNINCCLCCVKYIDLYKLFYLLSCLLENICIMVRSAIVMEYRCGRVRAIADFCCYYCSCLSEYQRYCFNITATTNYFLNKHVQYK